MATYQDAINAIQNCGIFITSEIERLSMLFESFNDEYTSLEWETKASGINNRRVNIIAPLVNDVFGKDPSALSQDEILQLRDVVDEVDFAYCIKVIDIGGAKRNIIAWWDLEQEEYFFSDILNNGQQQWVFIFYHTPEGGKTILPSLTAEDFSAGVGINEQSLPVYSFDNTLYKWYSTEELTGNPVEANALLEFEDIHVPSGGEWDYIYGAPLYAGAYEEDIVVKMHSFVRENGQTFKTKISPQTIGKAVILSNGQNVEQALAGGGGGGGDVVKIVYDETTMSVEDLGVAVKAVVDAGKIPAIDWAGAVYYCQMVHAGEIFTSMFTYWECGIQDGALLFLAITALLLAYTENDGWILQDAYEEIVSSN